MGWRRGRSCAKRGLRLSLQVQLSEAFEVPPWCLVQVHVNVSHGFLANDPLSNVS